MTQRKGMEVALTTTIAVLVAAGLFSLATRGQAQSPSDPVQAAKIALGLKLSPVPMNMAGKDPNLVGYGSFIVNVVAGCNDCHTSGPAMEYAAGGVPYFGQKPTVVNPKAFMGGGNDFGAFPDPAGNGPHIISRNLTPDASGLPEGGNTYDQFVQIMRTGIDMDHVHPTCTGTQNSTCIPAPFNGDLLQIMPWPIYANMPDSDLQAIYAYLSSIPCLEGGPGEPPNRCGAGPKTTAVASPKNTTVTATGIMLDGTQSISADGKPLTYAWTIPQGWPSVAMSSGNTATPSITFPIKGTYTFLLTVTDSTGKSASDATVLTYAGQ